MPPDLWLPTVRMLLGVIVLSSGQLKADGETKPTCRPFSRRSDTSDVFLLPGSESASGDDSRRAAWLGADVGRPPA